MQGYTFKKIWVIICARCNEDITRAQSGEEPSTRAEAEDWAREHEEIFHPDPRMPS